MTSSHGISRRFEVHGDGVGDDTVALQAAVDEASRRGIANRLGDILGGVRGFPLGDGGGVVLVPPGTYRLSAPIDVYDSVRIIGFGKQRPRFVLAEDSPGYAAGVRRDLFSFRRRPVGGPIAYANNDTFGSGLMNLDLMIGPGNPDAIAVRFGGAQRDTAIGSAVELDRPASAADVVADPGWRLQRSGASARVDRDTARRPQHRARTGTRHRPQHPRFGQREVVLRRVANWQFLGLQTEDHIYGWRSQAVELDQCHDLLFANSVFFRVATVLGPYPYGVGLRDSRRITFRGNRGYRDKTPEFTQWGAAVADVRTGRTVPDPEFTLLKIR